MTARNTSSIAKSPVSPLNTAHIAREVVKLSEGPNKDLSSHVLAEIERNAPKLISARGHALTKGLTQLDSFGHGAASVGVICLRWLCLRLLMTRRHRVCPIPSVNGCFHGG